MSQRSKRVTRWTVVGVAACLLSLVAAWRHAGAETAAAPGGIVLYASWRAPYGAPEARRDLSVDWGDSLRVERLYLSYQTPAGRVLRFHSISGALVFEPVRGDTLGPFWFFERKGANNGSLRIDFDMQDQGACQSGWRGYVTGHTGYNHTSARGRLDLSCDATSEAQTVLGGGAVVCFARITIQLNHTELVGWKRPMAVRWVGARFLTASGKVLNAIPGPEARLSWNGGVRGSRSRLSAAGVDTWVPIIAPPSWAGIVDPSKLVPIVEPDSLDEH